MSIWANILWIDSLNIVTKKPAQFIFHDFLSEGLENQALVAVMWR